MWRTIFVVYRDAGDGVTTYTAPVGAYTTRKKAEKAVATKLGWPKYRPSAYEIDAIKLDRPIP